MKVPWRFKQAVIVTGLLLAAWPLLALESLWLEFLPSSVGMINAAILLAVALGWAVWSRKQSIGARCAAATLCYVAVCIMLLKLADAFELYTLRSVVSSYGTGGFYLIGLLWVIWIVDRAGRRYEENRWHLSIVAGRPQVLLHDEHPHGTVWNPLDPSAWYYGRGHSKLNQSMFVLTAYSVLFMLAGMFVTWLSIGKQSYEMPGGGGGGGGGGAQQMASVVQVKVQKVIKKKFVVNPFSAIKFGNVQIDDVKLQLAQVTDHAYSVGQGGAGFGTGKGIGYGDGDGSGFAGGTSRGKIRLIRLDYDGGDWNLNFGIGGDANMLMEYGLLTQQKVADKTESIRIAQLAAFPKEKSPPVVFLTGQGSLSVSNGDVKILREYLQEKHGMLFASSGSTHFHNQFLALMNRVLPDVRPVSVPLDDTIHRIPFAMPSLPYVVAHGGKEALGWAADGRWLVYYHPGDISDAWADGHAGIPSDIYNACYQLGANVIFYGHVEYAKWLQSKGNGK